MKGLLILAGFALATAASAKCSVEQAHNRTFQWGTLKAGKLPSFLTNNPLPGGTPWGNVDPKTINPRNPPNTGVTRRYDFTISRGELAPDGYLKTSGILINGQFPGPTIEANWGDMIEVKVTNNITGPFEGTALHWHGLFQNGSAWYDGVPSVSQCPIAPGASFTYKFQAGVFGTSWYHSHYSAQAAGGLFGPLVVYGPSHVSYDVDVGPVMLADWFHKDYFDIVKNVMSTNSTLWANPSDNTLINARNPYNCSQVKDNTPCGKASYSKFKFQSGKTYKLRLINAGAAGMQYFSIDGQTLQIVSVDLTDIQPYNTTIVTLSVGQRSDVLFTPKAVNGTNAIWMRTLQSGKFCQRASNPEGKAIVLLDGAQEDSIPATTAYPAPVDDGTCKNDPLEKSVPYYVEPLPEPSTTFQITVNTIVNKTGHQLYTMNGSPFMANYNNPLINLAYQKNYSYPEHPEWNVLNFGSNSSVRVVIWNNSSGPHPMHIHGHDMFVLYDGNDKWDGTTIVNPSNPQRRDTHNLRPKGWMVMQYNLDNPGVWPFHCHIAWHLSMGMYVNLMENPEKIDQSVIPGVVKQTCDAWNKYTDTHIVEQIDSGL
ncbi:extracellular dihydrogeodin oxidase/laccase-like protein [Corynespora cassiicola Philippines]|uniref:Extracellular dihydrogeodin oxidase/laccase-like protein n=1 Tax=Corynespora cassiicola Philippines TaxID=1448308 RepID=A0A2T2P5G9_CORCC|nr:extracellular dihydrogeodin oxidase/laccase-like protein [Corynespora cassiicola Philippines]